MCHVEITVSVPAWRGDGRELEEQVGVGKRCQVRSISGELAGGRGSSHQTEFVEHVSFPDILGITQLGNPAKGCYSCRVGRPGLAAEGKHGPCG